MHLYAIWSNTKLQTDYRISECVAYFEKANDSVESIGEID